MLVLDTTRADALGGRGDHETRTPALDRLAAQGLVFENTLTVSSWTTPNHASLLTGLAPRQHKSVRTWLSESLTNLQASLERPMTRARYGEIAGFHQTLARLEEGGVAAALSARGYRTGIFPTNPNLFYLNDAFDVRPEVLSSQPPAPVDDSETVRLFEGFLEETEGPLFALVNLLSAHAPYEITDPAACGRAAELLDTAGPEPNILRYTAAGMLERWIDETAPRAPTDHLLPLLAELGYLTETGWFTASFFELQRQSDLSDAVSSPGDRALLTSLARYVAPLKSVTTFPEFSAISGVFASPSTTIDGAVEHRITAGGREALYDAYRCGLTQLDSYAERVVEDFLAARPEGYIAVVADHGESFGDGSSQRSYYNHAMLTPGVVHIPMFVLGPGITPGVSDAPTQIADLFPTILDWAGAEAPARAPALECGIPFRGESLTPLIRGAEGARDRVRLLETYPGTSQSFRFREPEYDCVWFGAERDGLLVTWSDSDLPDGACRGLSPMAFSLEPVRDRYEDIYDPSAPAQRELLELGRRCLTTDAVPVYRSIEDLRAAAEEAPALDEETAASLRSLGYL